MMKIIFINDMVRMVEAMDSQHKSILDSLPLSVHQDSMTTIVRNTKEISFSREEKKNISNFSNEPADKSQVFYTQSGDRNHPHSWENKGSCRVRLHKDL